MDALIKFLNDHPWTAKSDISVTFSNDYATKRTDTIIIKMRYNSTCVSRIVDTTFIRDENTEDILAFILNEMYNIIQDKMGRE